MIFECEKAWKDECNHEAGAYVGSFECLAQKYDLYVFKSGWGQSVCIRYGNEGSEYYSPGDLVTFLKSAHLIQAYQDALEMLQSKGAFSWNRK